MKFIVELLKELLRDPHVVTALVVAGASTAVLLAFRAVNPGRGAEHFYKEHHQFGYRIMQACYVVIVASIAFNLRYIVGQALTTVSQRLMKKTKL